MPRIALTKGRLLEPSMTWLEEKGFRRPDLQSRALCLPLSRGWEAVLLKGPDVAVFVQNGGADLGILGSDILEEYRPDVYDLRELPFGHCRMSLARPEPAPGARSFPMRVATKYPRTAERLLCAKGHSVRLIHLSSSVELAPVMGLSDAILDLVDTGRTLRENGLRELEVLQNVQSHLIANRSAYRFLDDGWWNGDH